jgi:prophage regulatory protein
MEQETLMRRPEVQDDTGLSRSNIYAQMAAGTFPEPVKISAKAVAWKASEIARWIEEREAM